MPGFASTVSLAKLALRRDKVMLPAWVYVVLAGVASNAYTVRKLYPHAASRASLAASGESNPALRFLYGRVYGDSAGALTAWRYVVWAAMFAALMAVFLVVRHTRAEEESGRSELVGSLVVGRHALLGAGLLVAAEAEVLLFVLVSAVLPLLGLPVAGSVALALAITTCGLAFTGIAAVAAQLTSSARVARGIPVAVLAVSFMLRAVGDAAGLSGGMSWLTWASPLGWTEQVHAFGAERWWVLALPLAVFVLAVVVAFWLAAVRDHGAGLLPDRPGRPAASLPLGSPSGLAWRLQRGTLVAWVAGYALTFAVSGAAAKGIGQLVGTSSALQHEFTRLGGQSPGGITDAYLAALMLLAGLAAAAYATSAILRLRSEETEGRAEPVLATAVGRVRWAFSHLVVAVCGAALLLAVAGVATGLGYGLRTGAAGAEVARLTAAAMGQLPAALALALLAVLLFGLLPAVSVAASWTAMGLVVVLALFGQVLGLTRWVMDVSPFTHTPRLPGGHVYLAPLLWLSATALALTLAGLLALRRRPIA